MAVRLDLRPAPSILPGYAGHCPQHHYHEYTEYGTQNHKLYYHPKCRQYDEKIKPANMKGEKRFETILDRIQKYTTEEEIARERARKYKKIHIKPYRLPESPYDPYSITSGLDTIYTLEGLIANYQGHIPARHIFVGKSNEYISKDAKKSLRWEVNGEGWEKPVVEYRRFLRYKKKS